MYLAIFFCFFFLFWLYYHYCYFFIFFFWFLLTVQSAVRSPQSAPRTPHPDPASSEKASQRGTVIRNAVAIYRAAVSNRLKWSPNVPTKPFSNLMKLLYLCLEMSSDSKNYFAYVVDGIFSRGHTMKSR